MCDDVDALFCGAPANASSRALQRVSSQTSILVGEVNSYLTDDLSVHLTYKVMQLAYS